MTETFQVGDRVRLRRDDGDRGTVVVRSDGQMGVLWDSFTTTGDAQYIGKHDRDFVLVVRPESAVSPHTSRLLSHLRSAAMHIAEATDHATRALSGDAQQVKARHEVMASSIANAARACAEAAYALGMEYMGGGK